MRVSLGLAALLLLSACQSTPPTTPPIASWVELIPGGKIAIRALTNQPTCPSLSVDGTTVPMAERAAPDAAFAPRTCAATAPQSAKRLTLAGQGLPTLPTAVHRIIVLGDTGCRLKGAAVQSCNDPQAWPFAQVVARAADKHPDLVIHVGDYHYRESPCPKGNEGCAGTPSGDNWDVWAADFFTPAAPLLRAAPWVMVRGNHELCGRGGKGWFRFLDPAATVLDCPDLTDAYAVKLDGLSLLVLDSAATDDQKVDPAIAKGFADTYQQAVSGLEGPIWAVTHRPFWALAPVEYGSPPKPSLVPLNRTIQTAVDAHIPSNMDMVIAGHVHTFASYAFGPSRPAQLVVGTGGSLYDKMILAPGTQVELDGAKANAFAITDYGYFVLDRADAGWIGTLHAASDDRVLATCTFKGRSADCH